MLYLVRQGHKASSGYLADRQDNVWVQRFANHFLYNDCSTKYPLPRDILQMQSMF